MNVFAVGFRGYSPSPVNIRLPLSARCALQCVCTGTTHPARVERCVLSPCDSFDPGPSDHPKHPLVPSNSSQKSFAHARVRVGSECSTRGVCQCLVKTETETLPKTENPPNMSAAATPGRRGRPLRQVRCFPFLLHRGARRRMFCGSLGCFAGGSGCGGEGGGAGRCGFLCVCV